MTTSETGEQHAASDGNVVAFGQSRPRQGQFGAVVMSRGRRVGTAESRIADRDGRLLVHGTTTCLIS